MKYAAVRLAQAFFIIIVVTFLTFVMQKVAFSDEDLCRNATGGIVDEATVNKCKSDLRLDEPWYTEYAVWAGGIATGDLGENYGIQGNDRLVIDSVKQRAPATGFLFLYGQIIALLIAVPLGIWSAYNAGRPPRRNVPRWVLWGAIVLLGAIGIGLGWSLFAILAFALALPAIIFSVARSGEAVDKLGSTVAFVLLSVPAFVLGVIGQWLFTVKWGYYDIKGYVALGEGWWPHFKSLWLPALVLGAAISPVYLRLLRTDMIANLQQDFVAVAKAKGLPDWQILLRHVLRPSTLTLLTVMGLNVAQLVNGAVVIELIYDIDGMGLYLLERVLSRQVLVVQSLVAMIAVLFVLSNIIVDLVYGVIDPRVRVERSSG